MYCCNCGSKIPKDALFCQECGTRVISDDQLTAVDIEQAQQAVLQQLLKNNPQRNVCCVCGGSNQLCAWDFGLAKPISNKRVWGPTAASIAVSAITLPLIGLGALELPGKRTTLSVLRLRLLMCELCKKREPGRVPYAIHPMWDGAQRLGYTQFLSAGDLNKVRYLR